MKTPVILACLALLLAAAAGAPCARAAGGGDGDWIRDTGDILQIALPVLGGGATFLVDGGPGPGWDREGTKQFAWAYGTAWTTTYAIKVLASKARPNGTNRTSYPSGHTMSAFAGAAFIDGRYGRTFGLPAYLLAAFTGYSRVHSGWHYRDDVLAGASIGMMTSWYFVSPLPGRVQLLPTVAGDAYGFRVAVGGPGGRGDGPPAAWAPRRAGYHFRMGMGFVRSNVVGGGPGTGHFALSDLEGFNDPTTTAVVGVELPAGDRGRLHLRWGPFEARDRGSFGHDVSFGGAFFPAGTAVESSWRYYDLGVRYDHILVRDRRWCLRAGGGVGLMYSYATLAAADGSADALVDETAAGPYLALAAERRLSSRWVLELAASGLAYADDWGLSVRAELVWRPARAWDLALGTTYFSRKIETDDFYNKVSYDIPYLAFKRFW